MRQLSRMLHSARLRM